MNCRRRGLFPFLGRNGLQLFDVRQILRTRAGKRPERDEFYTYNYMIEMSIFLISVLSKSCGRRHYRGRYLPAALNTPAIGNPALGTSW